MRSYKVFIFLISISILYSCINYKSRRLNNSDPLTLQFPRLAVQTKITEPDQKYYNHIHTSINSTVKQFLRGKEKDICKRINDMFQELELKPYSVPRERERERLRLFLSRICSAVYPEKNYFYNLSNSEYKYLNEKLPGSAAFYDSGDPQTLKVDPLDLGDYVYAPTLEDEYCKKAIQLGQWDHIFYLSDVQSGFPQFMACINKKTQEACRCPAATIMVAKILPKTYFCDTGWLNPSADPMDVRGALKDLTRALKAATGRDLDKEPPVPEFEELFKQKPDSTNINSE